MTIGAIDAGSNAIRVVVARLVQGSQIERVAAERVPVRLGRGAYTKGELDSATLDAAVEAFRRFRELFDKHGVDRYRAVATSAVRNVHNRDILLHRLFHETQIELEVIDGEEEARLIRNAVRRAFGQYDYDPPGAILDLGGGSLEVMTRSPEATPPWKVGSLRIGTVRLMETFGLDGAIGSGEAAMVRRYVSTALRSFIDGNKAEASEPAAACGGNAEALAKLLGSRSNGFMKFTIADVEHALPTILNATVEQRMERFEVRRDRAEVMGIAALVFATAGLELGIKELLVPGVGVRDGLLLEMVEARAEEQTHARAARAETLLASARTFASRVGHDATHGEQVRKLAGSLFEQLRDIHGLADETRPLLEVAALLHDVGEVIHGRSHHKHGEYMVRWGRIPGLESPQREMVAAIIRTHRKSLPNPKKHLILNELNEEQQAVVRKMGALLRLADAFDTDHRQEVLGVVAKRLRNTVALSLTVAEPPDEGEPVELRKGKDAFELEFGIEVTASIGGRALAEVAIL